MLKINFFIKINVETNKNGKEKHRTDLSGRKIKKKNLKKLELVEVEDMKYQILTSSNAPNIRFLRCPQRNFLEIFVKKVLVVFVFLL